MVKENSGNSRKEQGLIRARAIFNLRNQHNLKLPKLVEYINAKDNNGFPLHADITELILPNPQDTISKARIHQILMKVPEYKAQSSWASTRKKAKNEAKDQG